MMKQHSSKNLIRGILYSFPKMCGLEQRQRKRCKQKQDARGSRRFGAQRRRLTSLRKELGVNGLEVLLIHHAARTLLGS